MEVKMDFLLSLSFALFLLVLLTGSYKARQPNMIEN